MNYDAYGMMLGLNPTSSAPPTTAMLYSGEQFDVDLQHQYLRARYYDQSIGVFNKRDPFAGKYNDPQSLHKYTYTHNDPVNGIDPTGEQLLSLLVGSSLSQSISNIYNEGVLTVGGSLQAVLEGVQTSKTAEQIFAESVFWGTVGLVAPSVLKRLTRSALNVASKISTITSRSITSTARSSLGWLNNFMRQISRGLDDISDSNSFQFNMVQNPGPLASLQGSPAVNFAGGEI